MRKKILTTVYIILLLVISLLSFGQNGFKVGIAMGSIMPLNQFKSTTISTNTSGYSENGVSLSFDGDYFLHNRLAVSLRLNFGMTSIDEPSVIKKLDADVTGYLSSEVENNSYYITYWQWSSPLLGLKYNYPVLINKLYVETGIFSGISFAQIPEQNLAIKDEVNKQMIYSENIGENSTSVPLMADLALRYVLSKQIQLKFSTSYFHSKANYEHINYTVDKDATEITKMISRYNVSAPIETMNFSIGLIYSL
jgi:hypothetical protein